MASGRTGVPIDVAATIMGAWVHCMIDCTTCFYPMPIATCRQVVVGVTILRGGVPQLPGLVVPTSGLVALANLILIPVLIAVSPKVVLKFLILVLPV